MENQDLTISFLTGRSPETVFDAICNVAGWWTENIEGWSQHAGDAFAVRFGDVHYSLQELTEIVPGKKIVWLVTESRLSFLENMEEWTGTSISFDISVQDGQTLVRFTHHGLQPQIACYQNCSGAWGSYVNGSLRNYIDTGKGTPAAKAAPVG